MKFLYVFIGGGLGSLARYSVGLLFVRMNITSHFPWPTFAVNILGSFALGILFMMAFKNRLPDMIQPLLMAGFLGGFTTFSALSVETVHLLRTDQIAVALSYVLFSILGGLLFAGLGAYLAR